MSNTIRAEVVGSLLRPEYLKRARQSFKDGLLSATAFKTIEDRAVDHAIALQEGVGVDVITDGEMRREFFADHVFKELNGVDATVVPPPVTLHHVVSGESFSLSMPSTVTEEISRKRMLSPEEFVYARAVSHAPLKVTLSSPLLLHFLWSPEHSPKAYDDPYDLFRDAAELLREEALELARLGCDYIQIDGPELIHVLADEAQRQHWKDIGIDPERVVPEGVEIVNSVAAPIPGVTFALHVCRANGGSMYLARGGYGRFATELFPLISNFDRVLLEYDDERSGDLAPLEKLPKDKVAVLGLISTKLEKVEDPIDVKQRIKDAAKYVDIDRLALSTQCGFGSMEVGNEITGRSQEEKLRLVAEIAREVWG